MVEVPLAGGRHGVAIVDESDAKLVGQYSWTRMGSRSGNQYAVCARKFKPTILMHRLILGAEPGQVVDHKNGNGLDNRRENLRLCSASQNAVNRGPNPGRKYKGVYSHPDRGAKFQAKIIVNGRCICLGSFASAEDAARAYDEAAREHFGEFARLNFQVP